MGTHVRNYTLKKGLDLPIAGAAETGTPEPATVGLVAVLGADYIGLKPRLAVEEGDAVGAGAPLLTHKDNPDAAIVSYPSPLPSVRARR